LPHKKVTKERKKVISRKRKLNKMLTHFLKGKGMQDVLREKKKIEIFFPI
jgi:hypothetical protein